MGKKKANNGSLGLMDECITDAKALLEISLFNAQEKLKEKFTPQLKSLIAKRLQQEDEEIDDEDEEIVDVEDTEDFDNVEDEEEIEIIDDEEDAPVDEDEDIDIDIEDDEDEAAEALEDAEMDIEVDDLDDDEEIEIEDDEEDEEINLEAIMKQMEALSEENDDEEIDIEDDEEIDIEDDEEIDIDIEDDDEDVDIDEGEDIDIDIEDDDEDEDIDIDIEDDEDEVDEIKATNAKLRNELRKYRKGTKIFKEKIAEQKFVQAKLLYVNDMLKRKKLSEMQKYKIVEAFDKAKSISDIKLIYKTLFEAYKERQKQIKKTKSRTLKEGVASKTMLVNRKQRIIENNGSPMKDRFQILANIKKK